MLTPQPRRTLTTHALYNGARWLAVRAERDGISFSIVYPTGALLPSAYHYTERDGLTVAGEPAPPDVILCAPHPLDETAFVQIWPPCSDESRRLLLESLFQ